MPPTAPDTRWLLLVYELPTRPSNARVKTWRRLQTIGAVPVKDSVYVLPHVPESREDFEWVSQEIRAMKGQATVFSAEHIEPAAREQLVAAFRRARQQDYAEIRKEAATLAARGSARRAAWPSRGVRALQDRLARTREIDFFDAPGRDEAVAAVAALLRRMERGSAEPREEIQPGGGEMQKRYRQRTWMTRPRPGIDRMSSAWLIRRFIDPKAKFRFAEKPAGSAVPFDMYGVEFGHQGQHCTFETLVARFGIAHPAVKRMAQVVHDLDLKEERYGLAEAAAVGRMVEGLRQMYANDHELLEQGITMMESLYQSFAAEPVPRRARRKR